MVLAADFGVGQVVWSMLWFFLFIIWLMLMFRVFGDLFGSDDMSGVAKVLWTLFVIVFPYLGVFVYLIVRGGKMAAREQKAAADYEENVKSYIRQAAGTGSVADEIERLAGLRERGLIDDDEYQRLRARAVG